MAYVSSKTPPTVMDWDRMLQPLEFPMLERNAGLRGPPMTNDTDGRPQTTSPIAHLIRTRPEAFDFGDSPDTKPLSATYAAQMDAMRPAWTRDLYKPTEPTA